MGYIRRSFNHYCKDCGADISYRMPNTLYCEACTNKRDNERRVAEHKYFLELKARDTAIEPLRGSSMMTGSASSIGQGSSELYICPHCSHVLDVPSNFCHTCGQRIIPILGEAL